MLITLTPGALADAAGAAEDPIDLGAKSGIKCVVSSLMNKKEGQRVYKGRYEEGGRRATDGVRSLGIQSGPFYADLHPLACLHLQSMKQIRTLCGG